MLRYAHDMAPRSIVLPLLCYLGEAEAVTDTKGVVECKLVQNLAGWMGKKE